MTHAGPKSAIDRGPQSQPHYLKIRWVSYPFGISVVSYVVSMGQWLSLPMILIGLLLLRQPQARR